MDIISVTQKIDDHTLNDIAVLEIGSGYEQLTRVLKCTTSAEDEPKHVLIDQVNENGDLISDPIIISPDQAVWMLRDFFHAPKKIWSKIETM